MGNHALQWGGTISDESAAKGKRSGSGSGVPILGLLAYALAFAVAAQHRAYAEQTPNQPTEVYRRATPADATFEQCQQAILDGTYVGQIKDGAGYFWAGRVYVVLVTDTRLECRALEYFEPFE